MRRALALATTGVLLLGGVATAHSATGEEPTRTVPRDGLVDVHQTEWTELVFRDGGRELDVHYRSGPPICYGLDRVEVAMSEAGLDVRVFAGYLPPDEVEFCPQPRHDWVTTVDLGERMAFGSSGELEEAWAAWREHEVAADRGGHAARSEG